MIIPLCLHRERRGGGVDGGGYIMGREEYEDGGPHDVSEG